MEPSRRNAIHEAMVRLSDGDRSAMGFLVNELWPVILAFAERGVRQREDAEDVAQEVFLRICSRISDFDRTRDGVSWAFGIASYEVMTHRRRQTRRRETPGDSELRDRVATGVSQEDAAIAQELAGAMQQAIGALSDEDRLHLGLATQPLDQPLPSATLRKRRQRALDRLRIVWRKLYGEH
jgi:RNA polymerase sigma-70 factor (ECF subfamily)